MTHDARIRTLKISLIATAIIALLMFASLFTGLNVVMSFFLDLTHMPLDGAQSLSSDAEHLLTAISAGVLFGFCVALWHLTTEIYAHNAALGRRLILSTVLSWYVIDTAGSWIVGAWMNCILNTLFMLSLVLPILRPEPAKDAQTV